MHAWARGSRTLLIYQEIVRWLGHGDPTTRRLLEKILEEEEEHAEDIVDMLGV